MENMRRSWKSWGVTIGVVAAAVAAGLGSTVRAARPGLGVDVLDEAARGLAISPVPLNLAGKNRNQVGLGSYLVNAVGGCSGCHTHPEFVAGGDPFRGQPERPNAAQFLAGGRTFGPFFTSRNLTPEPDKGNLPAGLTLAQFIHVMRTGEDLDKAHPQISPLLQVMPWPNLGKMSDRDLTAIYAYLSAIPHAEAGPPGP
jgi:hypothetical protein